MSVVTFTSSIDFPLDMLFSVERKQLSFTFHRGLQVHGTRPQSVEVFQRVLRIVDAQVNTFMPMFQQQFTAILEIAIRNVDEWLPEIRQRKQQFLFHALPVPIG